jgi:C1A family cysteine protease
MAETRIDDIPELGEFKVALKSLGYRTSDQLIGAYKIAGDLLAYYLKTDAIRLRDTIEKLPRREIPRGFETTPVRKFALGVRLDRIPQPRRALTMSAVSAVPLPPKVNMVAQMAPIRSQGDARGTCVAHASLAVVEHYLGLQGKYQNLSRQFLYWDCKQNDEEPEGYGTCIWAAMKALETDGCCLESTWPYNPAPITGNEGQGPPPDRAKPEALGFAVTAVHQITATSTIDIKSELARNRCVAFSIPVFDSWYRNEEVQRTGEIVNPIPNENLGEGHAMCLVGYEDVPDEPDLGGGRFYIRNSWGNYWATESVLGTAGYGTIPYSYIERFGRDAYSIG